MALRNRKPTSAGAGSRGSRTSPRSPRPAREDAAGPARRPVAATPRAATPPATGWRPQAPVPPRRLQAAKDGVAPRSPPSSTTPTAPAASPCSTTRRREGLHPGAPRRKVGDRLMSGQGADIRPGNALPLRYIPVGTASTTSSCAPARAARWPARPAPASSWSPRKATMPRCACPRTEMRRVPIDCRATVGEVGNAEPS